MPVLYEKRNHVGWLTLSRPEARNAWGEDFNEEIARRCDEMASDPEIRVVVLTGDEAGDAFSAGANLKNPRTHAQGSMAEFIEGLPQRHRTAGQVLTEFPKPVIAAVNGYAVGIGCICDLLLRPDHRLRSRGMAAAAGGSWDPAEPRRDRSPGALGRQGTGDEGRDGVPDESR